MYRAGQTSSLLPSIEEQKDECLGYKIPDQNTGRLQPPKIAVLNEPYKILCLDGRDIIWNEIEEVRRKYDTCEDAFDILMRPFEQRVKLVATDDTP
jgi:hypothetical protein